MMTDVWRSGSPEQSDDIESSCDSEDQQELESFLYSLVHHDSAPGEPTSQGLIEQVLSPEERSSTGPQKGWRYFNVTPYNRKEESFSSRLEQLSEQYGCNTIRTRGSPLYKNLSWRKSVSQPVNLSRLKAMNNPSSSANRISPIILNISSDCNTASSYNSTTTKNSAAQEMIATGACQKDDIMGEELSPSPSVTNISLETFDGLCSNEDKKKEENKIPSPKIQTKENSEHENATLISQENDDRNNTNPSLSSLDDCFELPQTSFSKPKSKSAQNLNDCMTQVLGRMLDEDASRSSIESEKRPVQKPSKNASGSGWTVGMSWEDMSSKFRFNFEVDSVCGDSVMEGSISASSRANTPEPVIGVSPEPVSPDDVSKYDVSLKSKEKVSDTIVVADGDSDSEVESVVEVCIPHKEPPPMLEILSDSEDIIPAKRMKRDDDAVVIEEDIVILYESGNTASNREAGSASLNHALVSSPAVTLIHEETNFGGSAKKRQRPRRKVKKAVTSPGVIDDELSNILAGMSNDPNLWKLCREDIYPRPSSRKLRPCGNCKQRDHNTWHCPEPIKIRVCSLCAEPGHDHYRCPQKMCLNCGSPAASYIRQCHLCISNKQICNICNWGGHKTRQCPDLWRRYHCTTSAGPPIVPDDPRIRPSTEMWCCNCARKGHYSHDCPLPSSPINQKILSHVISYADPTRDDQSQSLSTPGRSGVPTLKIQIAKSSMVTRSAAFAKPTPETNAPVPPMTHHQSDCPVEESPAELSLVPHGGVFQYHAVRRNYLVFLPRIQSVDILSVHPATLADFLEKQLKRINKPVLNFDEVQSKYRKLMSLMSTYPFGKNLRRKAYRCASQLNMTLLGYGGLAHGADHVRALRDHIEALRQRKTKATKQIRTLINDHFKMIFKGCIRHDLNLLVSEYLKRKGRLLL